MLLKESSSTLLNTTNLFKKIFRQDERKIFKFKLITFRNFYVFITLIRLLKLSNLLNYEINLRYKNYCKYN